MSLTRSQTFLMTRCRRNLTKYTSMIGGPAEEIIYFFSKYEERLSAENGEEIDQVTWGKIWENTSKDKSVEHIFPQKDPNGNWKGKGRQKVNPESFVHRLGNLLVLPPGINSKAGTQSFPKKV